MKKMKTKYYLMLLMTTVICQISPLFTEAGTFQNIDISNANEKNLQQITVPVLCYHKFTNKTGDNMAINVQDFEKQLGYLKEHNFRSISLEEFYSFLEGKFSKNMNFKPVMITVDDGYRSFYEKAYPLLMKYGFSAVLFIPTDFISKSKIALSWSDLQDLASQGFEIDSHTESHPNFAYITDTLSPDEYHKKMLQEFEVPITKIQSCTRKPVIALALPYGTYDFEIRQVAQIAGYKMIFTTNPYPNTEITNPLNIGRFVISGKANLDEFIEEVNSRPLKIMQETPADASVITGERFKISAIIDDSEIDPGSIEMFIGTTKVPATFNPLTRRLFYQPKDTTKRRVFGIAIRARERNGGCFHFAGWLFRKQSAKILNGGKLQVKLPDCLLGRRTNCLDNSSRT